MKEQRTHYKPEEKVAILRSICWSRRRSRSRVTNRDSSPRLLALAEGVLRDNNVRLNSAIGYITPKDMLAGRQEEIHADRDRKLEAARQQRQIRRQSAA